MNHVLLAPMLRLARGVSFADSGLFSAESLSSDIVLAGLGVVLAMVWLSNVWLVPAIVAPLVHLVPLDPPARARARQRGAVPDDVSRRRRSA